MRRPRALLTSLAGACALAAWARSASADEPGGSTSLSREDTANTVVAPEQLPPSRLAYFQYGVSFTAELAAASGPFCATPTQIVVVPGTTTSSSSGETPGACALGSGGGITLHGGVRAGDHLYWGAALEVAKVDSSKLLNLAMLKQLRFEGRYYFGPKYDTQAYGLYGGGVVAYGEEFAALTWGATLVAGVGIETQVTSALVFGASLSYRPMVLGSFSSDIGNIPSSSSSIPFAHMLGIDITVEVKEAL